MYTCMVHSFCPFLCRKQLYGMKEIGYIIIAHVCVSHSNRSILHCVQQQDKSEAKEKNQVIMHINGHITASCIRSGASGPFSLMKQNVILVYHTMRHTTSTAGPFSSEA